jgi:hypothetical protein
MHSFKTVALLRERSIAMPNQPVVNPQYGSGSFKMWNDIVKHQYFRAFSMMLIPRDITFKSCTTI